MLNCILFVKRIDRLVADFRHIAFVVFWFGERYPGARFAILHLTARLTQIIPGKRAAITAINGRAVNAQGQLYAVHFFDGEGFLFNPDAVT